MTDLPNPLAIICRPAVYRIRVPGRLAPAWRDCFHGMTISVIEAESRPTVTEITGKLPDQAALMGILQRLYSCLIPLLSVECIEAGGVEK